MEQIQIAMNELDDMIELDLPNADFNIEIAFKNDSELDSYFWVINAQIHTEEGVESFQVIEVEFTSAVEKAKNELTQVIEELLKYVA